MNASNFFKTINLIFFALIAGISAFSIIVYTLIDKSIFVIPTTNDIFVFIVPAICVVGIVVGKLMYTKLTGPITSEKPIEKRIQILSSAMIVRYALTEGPALLSIVIVMLSENLFYYLFTALMLVVFVSLKPNKDKLSDALQLTSTEKEQMGIKDNYRH
jgi:hypothetical protein